MSKIPKSHNSKDSVTFVMTSHEAKCVTLETSVSKKCGKSLQPSTPEYSKKTTPKVPSEKCVTSVSNTQSTCKQLSCQKSSKMTTPKVVSDKCVTSKTSVSNTCKCGEYLQPNGQKSSKSAAPKVVSHKCVTSKTSVSNTCKMLVKNLQK